MKYCGAVVASFICFTLLFCFSGYAYGQEKQEGQAMEAQKPPAKAEETPAVTGTATMGVFSKYIFRGYELSKNSVVFQPGLTASLGGFSAGFWGNIDSSQHSTQSFGSDDHHKSFNETDLTLSYTKSFGKVSLTGGYIYYGTKYADETEEVFGTVAYDMIGKPTLSIYRDINKYLGTYLNFSLAHSIPLGRDVTLDLGASVGYMAGDSDYWKTNETAAGGQTGSKYQGLHDGKVQAGLTIPITKNVSFVPVVQYWLPLSDKAKRHWGDTSYNPNGYLKSLFVGGANINYNF
jgi:uncharacterized protein (TIGR02001 family)